MVPPPVLFPYGCLRLPAMLVMLAAVVPSLGLCLILSWCRDLCVSLLRGTTVLYAIALRSFAERPPLCFIRTEVQWVGHLLTIAITQTHWKSKQTSLPASLSFRLAPYCDSFGWQMSCPCLESQMLFCKGWGSCTVVCLCSFIFC